MTSCGTSVTGETPQAKPRRLTARPAESRAWSGNQKTLFWVRITQPFLTNYKFVLQNRTHYFS
ncbi:hypothetical protein FZC80_10145 [Rossellomorea aquimaris]|uniref:Uncharacterized protein n=1 Tax=Rossellomorea aquimaris TaxID=189382 RepID=A0A5D4TXA1_9BACI|nr:hypothetical protein FZC80_10145 [Rossellomorea aquimaris]